MSIHVTFAHSPFHPGHTISPLLVPPQLALNPEHSATPNLTGTRQWFLTSTYFSTSDSENFQNFTLALTISSWRKEKSISQLSCTMLQWQGETHGHRLSCLYNNRGHLAILAMVQEQKMPSFHQRGIIQSHRNLSFFYFFFLTHYFAIRPFIRK